MTLPAQMHAVLTLGPGGYDQLSYRPVPTPEPGPGEVVLQVLAAGMNNTDINTRLGWYAREVRQSTDTATPPSGPGGWNGATPWPMIQGTDCCGRIAALGAGVTMELGARVLVAACQRARDDASAYNRWLGVDYDGCFAQYVRVPASAVYPVQSDWSDAELASMPCAGGTAENMLIRADLRPAERVLVTGASGGVGSSLVQLARARGAEVIALTSPAKSEALRALGATQILARGANILAELGENSVDLVADVVGGPQVPDLLKLLRPGGRLVTAGAIAGPIVPLDLRDLYLKDLRLIGATSWEAATFPNLIRAIEAGHIRPQVAATYPLDQIASAQAAFQDKSHVGNFVLIPPEG